MPSTPSINFQVKLTSTHWNNVYRCVGYAKSTQQHQECIHMYKYVLSTLIFLWWKYDLSPKRKSLFAHVHIEFQNACPVHSSTESSFALGTPCPMKLLAAFPVVKHAVLWGQEPHLVLLTL